MPDLAINHYSNSVEFSAYPGPVLDLELMDDGRVEVYIANKDRHGGMTSTSIHINKDEAIEVILFLTNAFKDV